MDTARDSSVPANRSREERDGRWIDRTAKPYRLLYTLVLVTANASVVIYLFSLVLIYGPAAASRIVLGILIACAFISSIPFVPSLLRRRKNQGSEVRDANSLRRGQRIDRIITIVLWATVLIAFSLFISRGHLH
ncbi:MAG: hypothetical protein ACRD4C_09410 [Candidatus Acidiferrales bacterium]